MKNIKIYSTPTCPHCIMLKKYLDSKNIKYGTIDISSDPDMVQEMIEKSGQMSTPVIDIEGEIIVGFKKDKINEMLGIK